MAADVRTSQTNNPVAPTGQITAYALLVASDLSKYKDLVRQLRRPDWSLTRSYIGTEALRLVATGRYDLLFCEKDLPDIESTDLLQVVKNKFPWVKMVIFGEEASPDFVADATSLGLDYYLAMPATATQVDRAVEAVLARLRADADRPSKRVDLIVALRSLPAVPRVVLKLWEQLDSGDDTLQHIISLVRTDPGLTAMILRVANSVRYGSRARIRSLDRAISLMGLAELRSLSVVHSTRQVFRNSGQSGRKFDVTQHWSHSVRVAHTAELLAQKVQNVREDFAFSAGLLHDLGVLVLAEVYHSSYDRVIDEVEAGNGARYEVEAELLGTHHARAGGIICRHWNLPEYLYEPIRYHHELHRASEQPQLTAIVHLADFMVHYLDEQKPDPERSLNEDAKFALALLNLSEADIFDQIDALESYLRESAGTYGDLLHAS